jgi:hypothetical protein
MLYQLSHFRPCAPILPHHRSAEGGAEGQNRTDDTRLFRAVLYRLSYLGVQSSGPRRILADADRRNTRAGIAKSA